MTDINMKNLENMSPEELSHLQAMITVAQEKQKLGKKYSIHKAFEKILDECILPNLYHDYIVELEQKETDEIIPSIMSNDKILKFPLLMTLAAYFPISEIELRGALVELFDSFKYHSDMGIILSAFVPFDVDKMFMYCTMHDPEVIKGHLEEFYRSLCGAMNSPMAKGKSGDIIHSFMDNVMFMIHVVSGENTKFRFQASLQFMLGNENISGLNNEETHARLLDEVLSNGSDGMFARKISPVFRIK